MAKAKETVKKPAPKKEPAEKKGAVLTAEDFLTEVRAQAYLIYQDRVAKGTPGDSTGDWIEAERVVKKKFKLK